MAAAAAATWRAGEGSFEVQLLNLRNPGGYEARYFRRGGALPGSQPALYNGSIFGKLAVKI